MIGHVFCSKLIAWLVEMIIVSLFLLRTKYNDYIFKKMSATGKKKNMRVTTLFLKQRGSHL